MIYRILQVLIIIDIVLFASCAVSGYILWLITDPATCLTITLIAVGTFLLLALAWAIYELFFD